MYHHFQSLIDIQLKAQRTIKNQHRGAVAMSKKPEKCYTSIQHYKITKYHQKKKKKKKNGQLHKKHKDGTEIEWLRSSLEIRKQQKHKSSECHNLHNLTSFPVILSQRSHWIYHVFAPEPAVHILYLWEWLRCNVVINYGGN